MSPVDTSFPLSARGLALNVFLTQSLGTALITLLNKMKIIQITKLSLEIPIQRIKYKKPWQNKSEKSEFKVTRISISLAQGVTKPLLVEVSGNVHFRN